MYTIKIGANNMQDELLNEEAEKNNESQQENREKWKFTL
jgi:hypothetical protein